MWFATSQNCGDPFWDKHHWSHLADECPRNKFSWHFQAYNLNCLTQKCDAWYVHSSWWIPLQRVFGFLHSNLTDVMVGLQCSIFPSACTVWPRFGNPRLAQNVSRRMFWQIFAAKGSILSLHSGYQEKAKVLHPSPNNKWPVSISPIQIMWSNVEEFSLFVLRRFAQVLPPVRRDSSERIIFCCRLQRSQLQRSPPSAQKMSTYCVSPFTCSQKMASPHQKITPKIRWQRFFFTSGPLSPPLLDHPLKVPVGQALSPSRRGQLNLGQISEVGNWGFGVVKSKGVDHGWPFVSIFWIS